MPEISYWLAGALAQSTGWIEMNVSALARNDWIAIEDTDFWFPAGCRQLLHVADGTGMQDQHFAELKTRLRAFREESAHVA